MQESNCPICFEVLEVREVAPCDDCGWAAEEIEHFRDGSHTFATYEVFRGLRLVLCNFCSVDFGSYDPGHFGLSRDARIGLGRMQEVAVVRDASLGKDKYCPRCRARLSFLRFVQAARALHAR
jgi:hypothetical protein